MWARASHQREATEDARREALCTLGRRSLQACNRRAEPTLCEQVLEEERSQRELEGWRVERAKPKRDGEQRAGSGHPLLVTAIELHQPVGEEAAARRGG